MGIVNDLVAKALGYPTTAGYAERYLGVFMHANHLSAPKINTYRLDKSQTNPRFYERVYVGTAHLKGKRVGVLISYNEDSTLMMGGLIDADTAENHKKMAEQYKVQRKPQPPTFYRWFRVNTEGGIIDLIPSSEYGNSD
jgi:hypothetical protein